MGALWARIKQSGRVLWWILPLVILGLLWIAWKNLRPGTKPGLKPPDDSKLQTAVAAVQDRIAGANAQAAVEVAVARSKDVATRTELGKILEEPNGKRRRAGLVELARRVRDQ